MKFKLDFSIKSAQDRMNYIKSNINFSILSKKNLFLFGSYRILLSHPEYPMTSYFYTTQSEKCRIYKDWTHLSSLFSSRNFKFSYS